MDYEQNHYKYLDVVFGCRQDGPCVQNVGSVDTREGRLLTFPTVLQHLAGSFKLADPTKPGHQKAVALFFVDPNIKVISTAPVPGQRNNWWIDATLEKQSIDIHTQEGVSSAEQVNRLNDIPPSCKILYSNRRVPYQLGRCENTEG